MCAQRPARALKGHAQGTPATFQTHQAGTTAASVPCTLLACLLNQGFHARLHSRAAGASSAAPARAASLAAGGAAAPCRRGHTHLSRLTAASASKRSQPDRLLLELLSGPDKPQQAAGLTTDSYDDYDSPTTTRASTGTISSGDGIFASLDSAVGLGLPLRQGIINPNNKWYRAWWGLLIGAAAFTGIFVPWELGFGDLADMYSLSSVATWMDLILVALFMADIGECGLGYVRVEQRVCAKHPLWL